MAADPRPKGREDNMADTAMPTDEERATARHYLMRFEADTVRSRPLWIRLIIEFLGTFVLVTVAAGAGVINHYAGGNPVSRTAAVIAPGAVVMAMIYAWGPLSGLHNNPAVNSIGHNAALAVGATVALLGLFASPISGASMNPARSLGPDIVSTDFTGWWVYIVGPLIGAAIAVIVIGAVRGLPNKEERAAAEGDALPLRAGRRSG